METLAIGARGPQVELLQLALIRAGFSTIGMDGIFGQQTLSALQEFQTISGLPPTGVTDTETRRAILPYLTGYRTHTIRAGDTFFSLARIYGTTTEAITAANPGVSPSVLQIGQTLTIPLGFDVVPTNIRFSSTVLDYCVQGLAARYPFISTDMIGKSIIGKSLHVLSIGTGGSEIFYNASHHANEWLTTPVLMHFLENYAKSFASGTAIGGISAAEMYETATLYLVPMVDPDGVDLVTEELTSGVFYDYAYMLAENYPQYPFPYAWKANIRGVDLNLQYPAGWEDAREIKFDQGFTLPGPRDFVGRRPLSEPESFAVYQFTRNHDFQLTMSYHSQGEVIYWKYRDYLPPNSFEIAMEFARLSGYLVEETPYASGNAGYKDWFIQDYNRPGYTIEVGRGVNPLPIGQFDRIYRNNEAMLALGTVITSRLGA